MFHKKSVIPSLRNLKNIEKAIKSPSEYILLSEVNIGNLKEISAICRKAKKKVLVSVDVLGGFKGDKIGVKLLKNLFQIDGVVSTNVQVLRMAKQEGLLTVYRLFMIDSRSLTRAAQILKQGDFDCVEVLPGEYAYQKVDIIKKHLSSDVQLIASGFIETQEIADKILSKDFIAVTSSQTKLWN